MSEADKDDLGGDAQGAARNPMKADPGARDTSARGGPTQADMTGAVAAGGLAGSTPSAGAPTPDQRPSTNVQQEVASLREDADDLERQVDVRPDSELGRMGPGGSGVGNTVAPQGVTGGDRGRQ